MTVGLLSDSWIGRIRHVLHEVSDRTLDVGTQFVDCAEPHIDSFIWAAACRLASARRRVPSDVSPRSAGLCGFPGAALRRGAIDAPLIRQPARDHASHDAQYRADGIRAAGQQEARQNVSASLPLKLRIMWRP